MEKEKASIYDFVRMCRAHKGCKSCLLSYDVNKMGVACWYMIRDYPDKSNEIILKWCKEHPIKTRQSELLKAFPNVPIDSETVSICPLDFDKRFDVETCHSYEDCTACKKEYWLAEVEE